MWFWQRKPSEYRGHIDSADGGRVFGWVYDRLNTRARLDVEIYSAGVLVGTARADALRQDLLINNIGDGRYGFTVELPGGEFPEETISARVAGSDFWLLNAPSPASPLAGKLMNSARLGLPLLRPGISHRAPDDSDVAIAADLQREWQANASDPGTGAFLGRDTMWDEIISLRHRVLHDLLQLTDPRPLAAYLVDVHKSPASEGLAQGGRAYLAFLSVSPEGRRAAVAPFHDMLASLAQYLGVLRAECAEQSNDGEALAMDSEMLAANVQIALGHDIAFPTIFDGLFGLLIGDRILHGRDIQALYAALRVIEASGKTQPEICEIGAGFGKVAHYAFLRGVRHYVILDLPTVSALQYFYLRKALPGVAVRFRHPSDLGSDEAGIDLVFASHLRKESRLNADIVLNCDSFPEMGEQLCRDYFAFLAAWAPALLSINQEANRPGAGTDRQAVVGELLPHYGFARQYRFRTWIRRGYVEELWRAPPQATTV
jgi:hypothetical protein